MGLKDVPHYAPDVGLTAVDYIEPISPEKRLRRAELQIDKFLKETSPDRFSGSFFDAYTEQEGKMVQQQFELDPFTNTLFLFCGRKRDRIKGLYWERDGFILLYKRLEQGAYQWPRSEAEVKLLTPQQ